MKSLSDILEYNVSYQESVKAPVSKKITILDSLELIKSDIFKLKVEKLRSHLSNGDKAEYAKQKLTLPAITFCATFEKKRRRENLNHYNSIIVIDIDKLEDEELKKIWEFLENDPFTFTFWKSPSNKGIKGLVSINYNFKLDEDNIDLIHKSAFRKLSVYFMEKYEVELDNSGSDTTRLCLFSHDAQLILKEHYYSFEVTESDLFIPNNEIKGKSITIKSVSNKDALYNPLERNTSRDRKTIGSILNYLERKKLSITTSFVDWYTVAMSIANSFTYEIGLKYFKRLSALDKENYNEINCTNFLLNCYESRNGSIKFKSIIYLANKTGYLTTNQKKKGSEAEG